jgi:hypothetical protein
MFHVHQETSNTPSSSAVRVISENSPIQYSVHSNIKDSLLSINIHWAIRILSRYATRYTGLNILPDLSVLYAGNPVPLRQI